MYKGNVTAYKENPETGMAVAEVTVETDEGEAVGVMTVSDKIEEIQNRIKADLAEMTKHASLEEKEPPQKVFNVDENHKVT